jgi:acyl-CoA reductase-like NAD-dependent aldehyde dehydrogenase
MGDPKDPNTSMGPLISQKQLNNVTSLVGEAEQRGVQVVTGGKRMSTLPGSSFDFSKGYFYPPTVLADSRSAKIVDTRLWKEEAFGPVIIVVGFNTEQEALDLANNSEFGLGAAIWTKDLSRAFRVSEQIEAGICWGKSSICRVRV